MDYTIIIPVFNKAGLTRNCLRTLPPTLAGAGEGEVIVVDNASADETPEMLAEFDWITVVRNERNAGFAAANNQAARMARGRYLVLLNNDTQAFPGWLSAMLAAAREPGVGAVGARLLYPDDSIQHAGVVVAPVIFGRTALAPYHHAWHTRADDPDVGYRREYQVVTGACLVTPRELYLELGGLDETYWNGYEDVDYCFKVRERGLRVLYEPGATLYHFESQSGVQRFRKVLWNIHALSDRWAGRVAFDSTLRYVQNGLLPALQRDELAELRTGLIATPPTTVIVHGERAPGSEAEIEAMVRANRSPVARILYAASDDVAAVREAMRVRGDRYVALVRADCRLERGWLDELIAQTGAPPNVAASTFVPELPLGQNVACVAADARCTLLNLKLLPAHLELGEFDTLDGAVADLLLSAVGVGRGTRGASTFLGSVPPASADRSFERLHGRTIESCFDTDPAAIEALLRARPPRPRGLVSIVTLSWNAPAFTEKALASIRERTSEPYEVIVVDNGSDAPTLEMLGRIDDPHVRVIYNPTNLGFGGGNNVGMAAARGEYVVVLNNDVVVTEGWLDGLLEPFAHAGEIGVTAPRSNKVVGHQLLGDARYDSEEEMAAYAARRRDLHEGRGYFTNRAIGLCLCISRTVLEQIGGFDERFVMGNFEDDDFCVRVCAAGYAIYVCEDVFVHHFGSQSFAANKVDYAQTMEENWSRFAAKWGYPAQFPTNGYQPRIAIARGFDRNLHYAALPAPPPTAEAAEAAQLADDLASAIDAELVLLAAVRTEEEWAPVAELANRFARAFGADDPVLLAIGTFGPPAATLGARVERIFARLDIDPKLGAHVEVSDEEDESLWRERFSGARSVDAATLKDRSPSALRRLRGDAT